MPLRGDDLFVVARNSDGKNYKVLISDLLAMVSSGSSSVTIPGIDGIDGEDAFPVPGPTGATGVGTPGANGTNGINGMTLFMPTEDPIEPDMIVVPGKDGTAGTNGTNGTNGINGVNASPIWLPSFDQETSPEDTLPAEYPPINNWAYLGKVTGTGVTVGPLTWNELFDLIFFEYQIGGYNGGTPVGRVLVGSATISTTGATNGNGLNENGTNNATSVSVPGCPLAVTLSAIARSGWGIIRGASGALKQIDIKGQSGNPAPATSPTVFTARSFFSDLGTNLPIKRMQLTVYDTLITTAVSTNQFTATTFLRAWGIRLDPH